MSRIAFLLLVFLSSCAIHTPPEDVDTRVDKNKIRAVFLNHQKEIKSCYEIALALDGAVAGKIVLGFDIGEKGRVLRASVLEDRSTIKNNNEFKNCLVKALLGWTFPEPPTTQTVEVRYPLAFSK